MKIIQVQPSTFTVVKPVILNNMQNLPPKCVEHYKNINHNIDIENKA